MWLRSERRVTKIRVEDPNDRVMEEGGACSTAGLARPSR